jgi:cell division protein FtsQ
MSFFSSPNSNRRIKSGRDKRAANLLEVSARPNRENRLQIKRRFSDVFKLLLVAGLIAGAAFGGRGLLNRLIWENPSYALADIRVATDGLLTRAQVLELLEVSEGKNIFTVDVAKMSRELDALPQVEKVEVRRQLPDRLDIKICERQPVAWVAASSEVALGAGVDSLLVDTRGFVMKTRKVLPEHLALPRIIGVVMEDVAPGQKLPTAESLAALELIKLSTDDIRWQPRVVDVSKGYCLLVTDDRRARVTFGFDNIEGQLGRLRQLLDYVEPQNRELQSVNLMLERNIPVVFAPPPVVPTLPVIDPKTGKPKPGAKGAPVAQTGPLPGGISGGVLQGPASAVLNPAMAAKASAASAEAVARRSDASRVSDPESAGPKKTKAEPERVLKVAKLSEPAAARSKEPPQKEPAHKPVRRKSDQDREEEQGEEQHRAPKAARSGESTAKSAPRSKPAPQAEPEPPPRTPPPAAPSSVPPSNSLRKLFNPHG